MLLLFFGTMDETPIQKRSGAYLPHWTKAEAVYAVRFCLADSVPQEKLKEWRWERDDIIKTAEMLKHPSSADEQQRLCELSSDTVERFLRSGYGAC